MGERRECKMWLDRRHLEALLRNRPGSSLLSYALANLPEGAEIVRFDMDHLRYGIWVVFSHPSLDPVRPGETPPLADVAVVTCDMPVTHPDAFPPTAGDDILERYGDHAVRCYRTGKLTPEEIAGIDAA